MIDSPLIPPKEGYPIKLNQRTSGGNGIKLEDLESEPTLVTRKSGTGQGMRLVATYSPFMMKGATGIIREQNASQEAKIELIAVGMASQWRVLKEPSEPYKPLLKDNARDATEDEEAEALLNAVVAKQTSYKTRI